MPRVHREVVVTGNPTHRKDLNKPSEAIVASEQELDSEDEKIH